MTERKSKKEANRIYEHVIENLGTLCGRPIAESPLHVLELPKSFDWRLYVRISTSGFWGLSPLKAELLERLYQERWSVLLVDGSADVSDSPWELTTGHVHLRRIYCVTPLIYSAKRKEWTIVRGEFRINEGKDLEGVPSYPSLEHLIRSLEK